MAKRIRNNKEVILAFLNRQVGVSNSNKSLRTGYNLEGELCLYSYGLCIARYTGDGAGQGDSFYFYDYTAGGGHCVSQTTSTHVGLVKRMAPSQITEVMRPDAAKVAGLV